MLRGNRGIKVGQRGMAQDNRSVTESRMAFNQKLAAKMGLTKTEMSIFRKLKSPEAIQDFLTAMPSNAEPDGDTCYSVRSVLRHRVCHCIEAAFVAACAFMLHGQPAILMDMEASGDDDHVLALFKRGRHWGAISKSNHIWLRWRDPIYKSPRELAMSYFHEYVFGAKKTLRRYSPPYNIGARDPSLWITNDDHCWDIAGELCDIRHLPLITSGQARRLRKRERFEIKIGELTEF
jgi:hypothetical protein